jgi:hypothetical protein
MSAPQPRTRTGPGPGPQPRPRPRPHSTMSRRILLVHELLEYAGVRHQFGGAIALAWYRAPRATTNVDVNLTIPPTLAEGVCNSLAGMKVRYTGADRDTIARDGQAGLEWDGVGLHLFFATVDLHQEMARRARTVPFGPMQIPILAPEHLAVCKAIFNRPQDWLDIEEMVAWGTEIDARETIGVVSEFLGSRAEPVARLTSLLAAVPS